MTRVLVGDSVFEDATVTVRDGWLSIEFDAEDIDSFAVNLAHLAHVGVPERGGTEVVTELRRIAPLLVEQDTDLNAVAWRLTELADRLDPQDD